MSEEPDTKDSTTKYTPTNPNQPNITLPDLIQSQQNSLMESAILQEKEIGIEETKNKYLTACSANKQVINNIKELSRKSYMEYVENIDLRNGEKDMSSSIGKIEQRMKAMKRDEQRKLMKIAHQNQQMNFLRDTKNQRIDRLIDKEIQNNTQKKNQVNRHKFTQSLQRKNKIEKESCQRNIEYENMLKIEENMRANYETQNAYYDVKKSNQHENMHRRWKIKLSEELGKLRQEKFAETRCQRHVDQLDKDKEEHQKKMDDLLQKKIQKKEQEKIAKQSCLNKQAVEKETKQTYMGYGKDCIVSLKDVRKSGSNVIDRTKINTFRNDNIGNGYGAGSSNELKQCVDHNGNIVDKMMGHSSNVSFTKPSMIVTIPNNSNRKVVVSDSIYGSNNVNINPGKAGQKRLYMNKSQSISILKNGQRKNVIQNALLNGMNNGGKSVHQLNPKKSTHLENLSKIYS